MVISETEKKNPHRFIDMYNSINLKTKADFQMIIPLKY